MNVNYQCDGCHLYIPITDGVLGCAAYDTKYTYSEDKFYCKCQRCVVKPICKVMCVEFKTQYEESVERYMNDVK